ncbi:MAG: hypothetical protein WA635_04870, partial [Gallionella sp.]
PEFTNQVQHSNLFKEVLRWDKSIRNWEWRSGVKLPVGAEPGKRSGKSRQVWIARHQALLGN